MENESKENEIKNENVVEPTQSEAPQSSTKAEGNITVEAFTNEQLNALLGEMQKIQANQHTIITQTAPKADENKGDNDVIKY